MAEFWVVGKLLGNLFPKVGNLADPRIRRKNHRQPNRVQTANPGRSPGRSKKTQEDLAG